MPSRSEKSARERRRAAYYIGRIFRFLRTCRGWTFRYGELHRGSPLNRAMGISPKHALAGNTKPGMRLMVVDHRFDVIPTFVHECLHAAFGEKTEREVLRLERLVMRHLTAVQAARLHELIGRKLAAWSRR